MNERVARAFIPIIAILSSIFSDGLPVIFDTSLFPCLNLTKYHSCADILLFMRALAHTAINSLYFHVHFQANMRATLNRQRPHLDKPGQPIGGPNVNGNTFA